jgi:hypothetical protein
MRNLFFMMMVMVLTVLMAGPALANQVSVNFDAGNTNYITEVEQYTTTGDLMAGMLVTATFENDNSEQVTWEPDTSITGAGIASGTGWSLAESGDTFLENWTLQNTSASPISEIRIDPFPGYTVFDTTFPDQNNNPQFGTTNSEYGWTFDVVNSSPANFDISATYRDAVALDGTAPVGDLYRYLDIVFNNGIYLGEDDYIQFGADTDNVSFGNFIPTPLPGTFLLLGSGLLGLVGFRRICKV